MTINSLDQIPDGVKVVGAVSAPVLTILGLQLEEWTFVLSSVVSILFIIEKLPTVLDRCRDVASWFRRFKRKR